MATRKTPPPFPVFDQPIAPTEDVTDETAGTAEGIPTAEALAAPVLSEKEIAAAAKRKVYSDKRRARIKAEEEAAGLVLQRQYVMADGSVFTSKKDAARYIASKGFLEFVAAHPFAPVIDGAALEIPAEAISEYVLAHRAYLLKFLRSVA